MRTLGLRLATAVLLALALAPPSVHGQPAAKVWRVGILATANPQVYDDTVDELRKLGYADGRSLAVEVRSADGKPERFPALAAMSSSRAAVTPPRGPLGRRRRRSRSSSSRSTMTRWRRGWSPR